MTEQVAPGVADSFHDHSSNRLRREVFHFIDCVLGRETPLITPEEMWTDQAIVDGIYAGGTNQSLVIVCTQASIYPAT